MKLHEIGRAARLASELEMVRGRLKTLNGTVDGIVISLNGFSLQFRSDSDPENFNMIKAIARAHVLDEEARLTRELADLGVTV